MATDTYHLSFRDHLALYLPPFLRPPLPRDLRSRSDTEEEDEEVISVLAPPTTPPPITPLTASPTTLPVSMSTPQDRDDFREADTVVEGSSCPRTETHSYTHHESEPDVEGELSNSGGTRDEGEEVVSVVREPKSKEKKRDGSRSRVGYHVSLILTNSGSVARDHLASERTFLAYVRTSLALATTGVVLVQLFTIADSSGKLTLAQERFIRRFATPLGSTMIILGLITLLLGCSRYFAIQLALTRGVFPAARLTVMFIVVMLSVLTGLVFGVLLKGRTQAL